MPSTTTTMKHKLGKKILVVEDEGEMSLVLDMILNERNLQLDYVKTTGHAGHRAQKP